VVEFQANVLALFSGLLLTQLVMVGIWLGGSMQAIPK